MKEDGTAFLTLLHPVVPMSCYDNECSFTSNNCIGTRIANSFESHIFRKHNLRTSRRWKCSSCYELMCGATKRRHICSHTSQVLNLSNTSSISIPIFTPTPIDLDYSNASDTSNSSIHATLPTHAIDTEQQETQRSTHSSQHTNTSPSEIILNNWKDKLFNFSDKEELNSIIVSLSKIILTEGNKLLIPEQVSNIR